MKTYILEEINTLCGYVKDQSPQLRAPLVKKN